MICAVTVPVGHGIVIDTPLSTGTGMLTVQFGDEVFFVSNSSHQGAANKGSTVEVVQVRGSIMNYGYTLR